MMPTGKKFKNGYATVRENCLKYREIAEAMTDTGDKMNHSTARNIFLSAMKNFKSIGDRLTVNNLTAEQALDQSTKPSIGLNIVVERIESYVEKLKETKGIDHIRGILAAPKITSNAEKMLKDWGFAFVAVNPPKYFEKYDADQQTLGSY